MKLLIKSFSLIFSIFFYGLSYSDNIGKTACQAEFIDNNLIPQLQLNPKSGREPHLNKLTENQMLEEAEKLENKINSLFYKIKDYPSKNVKLKRIGLSLQTIYNSIMEFNTLSSKFWANTNSQVEKLEKELNMIIYQNLNLSFGELLKEPPFLLNNHSYLITFQNNKTYYIQFDKKVTKSFNKLMEKQRKKILTTVKKGFTGGRSQESGLKILNQSFSSHSKYSNKKIVEIRTVGNIAGHIRIGGYIDGNKLTFSDFVSTSDHSKSIAKTHFKESIYQSSRKKR